MVRRESPKKRSTKDKRTKGVDPKDGKVDIDRELEQEFIRL